MAEKKINYHKEIQRLKKEKAALILAHYYQTLDIQDIADFVGDSYDLSVKARNASEDIIVFCGVDFMAETAKILSPTKMILHPVPTATCPMANMISAADVLALRKQYPEAEVACYVNTTAEVKAVSDVCVTSSSAVTIINKLQSDTILFVPDENLASYIQRFTTKKIIPGKGYCYVHKKFESSRLAQAKAAYPDAIVLVHPECTAAVIDLADAALSTSGMLKYIEQSKAKKFIIGTEQGIIDRMERLFPDRQFFSCGTPGICVNMKKIKLADVYHALLHEQYAVQIEKETIAQAQRSLHRMIELNT